MHHDIKNNLPNYLVWLSKSPSRANYFNRHKLFYKNTYEPMAVNDSIPILFFIDMSKVSKQ